jgi:hypothetical protein
VADGKSDFSGTGGGEISLFRKSVSLGKRLVGDQSCVVVKGWICDECKMRIL